MLNERALVMECFRASDQMLSEKLRKIRFERKNVLFGAKFTHQTVVEAN